MGLCNVADKFSYGQLHIGKFEDTPAAKSTNWMPQQSTTGPESPEDDRRSVGLQCMLEAEGVGL